MQAKVVGREGMPRLWEWLIAHNYLIVGPTVRDEAIVYDELPSVESLPIGWTDEQQGGRYRLKRRDDAALFGYALGPHSWKQFLFPSSRRLWKATRTGKEVKFEEEPVENKKFAFLGVRACERSAIEIQDRIFQRGPHPNPFYSNLREKLLLIGVSCHSPSGTCFCVSMNTGPKCGSDYDVVLTELLPDTENPHEFVFEPQSELGRSLVTEMPGRPVTEADLKREDLSIKGAAAKMGRQMDTRGIKDLLYQNHDHPRWKEVASRCLSCANCTMVCPTCFCSTVEDKTDLTGDHAERWRKWDSCFTLDHSYLHGGSVRVSTESRYRQWMTHKLASWQDQFGTSGCVGCGRCIAWCPVGIDITEEVAAIQATQDKEGSNP